MILCKMIKGSTFKLFFEMEHIKGLYQGKKKLKLTGTFHEYGSDCCAITFVKALAEQILWFCREENLTY